MTDANNAIPADHSEIRTVVSRAQEQQNNLDGLLALHSPEVIIVNVAGRRVIGGEAWAAALAQALASPLRDVLTEVEIIDVRLVTPDVAIVSCVKTIHDGRSDAEALSPLPSTGALTYVLVRMGDDWRITLAQTTPIAA